MITMNVKKLALPIFLFMAFAPLFVVANQPVIPAHYYVKEVRVKSDIFHFLYYVEGKPQVSKIEAATSIRFPFFDTYFEFEGVYRKLILIVNGKKIVDLPIDLLRVDEVKQDAYNTHVMAFRFPDKEIAAEIFVTDTNSSDPIVKIYLDDELVREYTLGYMPEARKGEPTPNKWYLKFLLPGLAVVILVSVGFLITRRNRK